MVWNIYIFDIYFPQKLHLPTFTNCGNLSCWIHWAKYDIFANSTLVSFRLSLSSVDTFSFAASSAICGLYIYNIIPINCLWFNFGYTMKYLWNINWFTQAVHLHLIRLKLIWSSIFKNADRLWFSFYSRECFCECRWGTIEKLVLLVWTWYLVAIKRKGALNAFGNCFINFNDSFNKYEHYLVYLLTYFEVVFP